MGQYDAIYRGLVLDIIDNGIWDKDHDVRTTWADGTPAYTKGVFGRQLEFDELPIPTTKQLAWKTAIKEVLLFWVNQTTKKEDFHQVNCHVWDEWFLEDGTIGKSYAYQFESRPKDEVILVKSKKVEYKNKFTNFIVSELLKPNTYSEDEVVGKVHDSRYGKFIILDTWRDEGYTNNKAAKIQFLDTGYIAIYPRSEVMRNRIYDPYFKSILGVAAYGDITKIKNIKKEHIEILYTKWHHMIHRCYNEKDTNYKNYGAKGVKVCDEWLLFENYVRDIRYLKQWNLAKEKLDSWFLDKDYYDSNLYSLETCVWLSKRENDTYRIQSKPFKVIHPDGKEEIALNSAVVAQKYNLNTCSISRAINNNRNITQTKGYKFERITPPDGYVYRYKLSRNQVTDLINNIKNNPSSRRLMTSFWNDADVEEKALQECAYETIWNVENGRLNLILGQRSLDVGLGCSFNQFQYYVLMCMIAQVCNLKVGKLVHQIGSAHIYERHLEPLKEQIERTPLETPEFWINPEINDFFNFTIDDFKLIDYKFHPKIEMEVAI